jgi:hypothetical protein
MDIKIGSLRLHWASMSRGEFRARALVYGVCFGAIGALAFAGEDEKKFDSGIYNCTSEVDGSQIRFHSDNAKFVRDPVSGPQMQVQEDGTGKTRTLEVNGSWICVSPKGERGQINLRP